MRHLAVLLLVLVSLTGFLWLEERDIETRLDEATARARTDLREVVANTAQAGQAKAAYERLFQRVGNAIRWDGDVPSLLAGQASEAVQIYLFDARGKRVNRPDLTPGLVYASEQCFALIRARACSAGLQVSARESRLLDSFLGNADALDQIIQAPGRLVSIISRRVERLVGIFPFRDRFAKPLFLMGIVAPSALSSDELVREALVQASRKSGPSYRFGARDLLDPAASPLSPGHDGDRDPGVGTLPPLIGEPFAELGDSTEDVHDGRLFATAWAGRRYLVFGSVPLPDRRDFERPRLRATALVAAGFALLAGWTLSTGVVLLPLNLQILGLFALTGLGALTLVLGFAGVYAEVRQKSLVRELQLDAEEVLMKVDSRYQAFLQRRAAALCRVMGAARNPRTDLPRIKRHLKRFQVFGDAVSVHLVDEEGRILWAHQPKNWFSLNRILGARLPKIISRIAQGAMQRHNSELGFAPKLIPTAGDLEDALYMDLGVGFFHGRGLIRSMNIGGNHLVAFADIAFDERKRAVGFLLITFEDDCLERAFLGGQRRTLRRQFAERGAELLYRPVSGLRQQSESGLDLRSRFEIRRMNSLVAATLAAHSRIWDGPAHRWMLSGVPGKSLDRFNLFLRTNLKSLDDLASLLSERFTTMSIAFAFFILGLGTVFSGFLLPPLAAISEAVRDLAQSRFSNPPEVRTGDLLESISEGVAGIMAEKAELASARVIGEHLFPREALHLGELACQGWVRSSSSLGGWIYDHQSLHDGSRCAFWMAGRQGLPIQSALVLAMRKMAFHLLLERPGHSPVWILDELERFMPRELTSEAAEHLLLGIVEPATGNVTIAVRGAFSLCVVRSATGYETLPATDRALPLALLPGDRLLIASGDTGAASALRELGSTLGTTSFEGLGPCFFAAIDRLPSAASADQGRVLVALERRSPIGGAS